MDGDKQSGVGGQKSGWVFKPSSTTPTPPQQTQPPMQAKQTPANTLEEVEWTASEFIAHHKGAKWYLMLAVFAIVLAGMVYYFTNDEISTGVVLVASFFFGVAASRKPRVLAYRLDDTGLTIGQKFYPYNLFRSFTIVDEGAFSSITLLPIKRFQPAYTIYYAPDDEEKIISVLGLYLPFEQRKDGIFDSIVHRIRF